jgi:hypothetical protein
MTWAIFEFQTFWTLVGVVVGGGLTLTRDLFLDWRNQSRLQTYAAVRIVCVLDEFSESCLSVALDDGEFGSDAQYPELRTPAIETPTLASFASDIDWKSLGPNVTYKVLRFPIQIEEAHRSIDFVNEAIAGPPDYEEYFEERQLQHAKLGLIALSLSSELRRMYSLPGEVVEGGDRNPAKLLKTICEEIDLKRKIERESSGLESSSNVV